jgi:hypothetical protein
MAVKYDFGLTCIKSGQQEAGRPGLARCALWWCHARR